MTWILALTVGVLYAAAVYMMLRPSVVRLVIGLLVLSHASNLLIFACGGVRKGGAPIIPPAGSATADAHRLADPLPQALILTAIVISFGVLAFALILSYRSYTTIGTDDPEAMKGDAL